MREKRNLIWISVGVILVAALLFTWVKNDAVRNLSIGIMGSALVSFFLVCSEYFTQKHDALKEVYLRLVEVHKLLVERFRYVNVGKEYEERAIKECLELIPSKFFSQNNLSIIKLHIQDEINNIAETDSYRKLSALYKDAPKEPGMLQGDEAATAILKSRIFLIMNNIDVILQIVENNRRIRIDQVFRPLCFFSDDIYRFIAKVCKTLGKENLAEALHSKMKITEIQNALWDPAVSMFAAFEQFTPGIFAPFREGYDGIPLLSLQRSYFYAVDSAFRHPSYKRKPYEEEPPYKQFLGGFTKGLQELEDIVFYRKRRKKTNA